MRFFRLASLLPLQKALLATAAVLALAVPSTAPSFAQSAQQGTLVTVDQAFVLRLDQSAGAVVIGNPAIADATIMDARTLVITGRSFGTTNLIVLNGTGETILEQLITVQGANNQVTVYRRDVRQSYSCTPICAPTLNVGDAQPAFELTNDQIQARADLALGAP